MDVDSATASKFDASTTSLLILFFVNFSFLILVMIFFGIIRKVRGDKAKVKLTKKYMQKEGMMNENDLETLLLDPKKSKMNYFLQKHF